MALPTLTYGAYKEMGGTANKATFNSCLRPAVAAVREVMGFNEPKTEHQRARYLAAVAEAVNVDAAWGGTHGLMSGASITVGSFSMGAGTAGAQGDGFDDEQRRAIRRELLGTGLLCRVVA